MSKLQINLLKKSVIKFDAQEITDIPPFLWSVIGFTGKNEEKINFLIHMVRRVC